ncbi:histidine--tRNA ligase [Candidatus Poribacteria bacterium]|nr:histidine--tRNA ligase [Candidatus Poribacteria bacterium]
MSTKQALQTIRGMDDVLPQNASSTVYRSELWTAMRRLYGEWAENHGYRYIETPVVEYTELFKRTSGETSDIVSKEMYTFEDAGGRSLSLRPEGSASVCRALVQHGLTASGTGLKFYYIAPMFRSERPQKGRYRQHTQLGLEVFREEDPTADAEVIAVLYGFFRKIGLGHLTVHINSVGSPACRPAYRELLVKYLEQFGDKLSEDSRRRIPVNPMRVLDSKAPEDAEIVAGAPVKLDHLDAECGEHFEGVKAALAKMGIAYSINPRLVRGLDYYTKTAFEVTCDSLDGAIKVIGGGGRYDGLIEQIGGQPTCAVGYGSGIERVLLACESQGIELAKPPVPLVTMAYMDDTVKHDTLALAEELRRASLSVEFPYRTRSLSKQLQAAAKSDSRFVVIVGGEEWSRGEVLLKDLVTRDQRPVAKDKLAAAVSSAAEVRKPML